MADFKPFAGIAQESSLGLLHSSIVLLRKIVKLLEPSGFRDSAGRQRVVVDSSVQLSVKLVAGAAAIGGATVTNVDGFDRRQFMNQSRTAYETGIRSKLKFN